MKYLRIFLDIKIYHFQQRIHLKLMKLKEENGE